MEFQTRAVRPVRPAAGYVGGKKQLAAALAGRIAAVPHQTYAEVFVGMGGVFFKREAAPSAEVINDRSRDVATLFRVLQRHYQAFTDMLKWQVSSRSEFERLMGQDPDTLTDLERAARFLYLQRLSFGGKVSGRTFGVSVDHPARLDVRKLGPILEAVHERLAGVWIECLPFERFIQRWDRPATLFFLDPPYWGSEHYYGSGMFGRADFTTLADVLKGLRGAFIMTLNDVPEVRELFAWASIETADVTYTVSRQSARPARELIITGGIA